MIRTKCLITSAFIIMTLVLASGIYFLHENAKQSVRSEAKTRITQVLALKRHQLGLLNENWHQLLLALSNKPLIKAYSKAVYDNYTPVIDELQPKVEELFLDYAKIKPDLIRYIRIIGPDGIERALVKNQKISTNYKNRNNRAYFAKAKLQPYNVVYPPFFRQTRDYTGMDWSITLGEKENLWSVISMTLDLKQIESIISRSRLQGIVDKVYLVNSQRQRVITDEEIPLFTPLGFAISDSQNIDDIIAPQFYNAENGDLITTQFIPTLNIRMVLVTRKASLAESVRTAFVPVFGILILTVIIVTVSFVFVSRLIINNNSKLSSLQTNNQELNNRVAERTRALTLALKDAQHAAQIKSDFLANMSHEIRTPMNGVIGLLELLKGTNLDEVQKKYVKTALRSGSDLMTIINDILDYSKIDAGKLNIEIVEFELKEIKAEIEHLYLAQTQEKDIKLQIRIDNTLPDTVLIDPTRLRQIINNLISNAIKFTKQGSVSLILEPGINRAQHLLIRVVDTGIGIDPEVQKTIFDPFAQADNSTTRVYGGTGLGLAICKHLVELMEGEIEIHSQPGKGTTIQFYLPYDTPEASKKPTPDQSHTVADTHKPEPSASTILLVEDNDINQMVAIAMLEKLGYQTIVANDGELAIEAVKSEQFDLILMDIQMPNMDGYTATRIIRSLDIKNACCPILALTANAMQGDREKCTAAGMDDYITKPIDIVALEAKLSFWLDNKKSTNQQAS